MRRFNPSCGSFDHILVHLDIDVLDPWLFHSTYFANPSLTGMAAVEADDNGATLPYAAHYTSQSVWWA